ncbi:helix-turn-helix domain-containing protein [Paenibacillus agilis]|uniref:Uncharacterized protein n=1 Tax=Paenibacillus agilis TaxID=3020863 RepID=A0A559IZH0_9BACL|nr:helix-turn-helix domain containing protein [Paenibacillus agilis]TVX93020.1 hypothetical protein FPZ44_08085 [Paenibacillus agilis]
MPDKSYPFPTYSGLLEPKHYKQIGTAIWLFLWFVSSTTKDIERDGTTWGVVLGNKPIKIPEIVEKFGVTERTVRTWIKTLEEHEYIRVTRAPQGLIFTVRNSKKFRNKQPESSEENFRSVDGDRKKITDQKGSDRKNFSERSEENFRSNKDITRIHNTTTTDSTESETERFENVFQAYCRIHGKLDIHVKALDVTAMQQMIALGVPTSLIIRVMETIYQERGGKARAFSYYRDAILEAWETEKAITSPSKGTVALGSPSPQREVRSKKQRELDDLRRRAEEARKREQG